MNNCVFCDTSKIKSRVTEQDGCLIFEPLNPVTVGHVLVAPKEHVSDFTDNVEVTAKVMRVAALYAKLFNEPCNLITSKGHEATQSVFHLHVHVVPRREGDGLHLPWTNQKTS